MGYANCPNPAMNRSMRIVNRAWPCSQLTSDAQMLTFDRTALRNTYTLSATVTAKNAEIHGENAGLRKYVRQSQNVSHMICYLCSWKHMFTPFCPAHCNSLFHC